MSLDNLVECNQGKDPGASSSPTGMPAVAQTSSHGLQVSAFLNPAKSSNPILEGTEHMVAFESHRYHGEFMSCDL